MKIFNRQVYKEQFFEISHEIYICLKISWHASKILSILRILFEILLGILPVAALYISKDIINILADAILNKSKEIMIHEFLIVMALFLSVQILLKGITKGKEYCDGIHNELVGKLINLQIAEKSLEVDLSYFDDVRFYLGMVNARRDSNALQTFTWQIISAIRAFIQFISACLILTNLNIFIAIAIVIIGIPALLLEKKYTGKFYIWERSWGKEDRKMGYLMGIITGQAFAKDVRLFNIGRELIGRYVDTWNIRFGEKKELMKKRSFWVGLMSFLPDLSLLFVMFFTGVEIIQGKLTVGDYSLYTGAVSQLIGSIFLLIAIISGIYQNKMMLTNYRKFLDQKSMISDDGKLVSDYIEKIEFVNVSFQYPGTEKYILHNFNLQIGKMEKIALVGLNGAGKSTVIKLLLRFYEPTEGCILINGKDIRLYDLENYRKHFSVLFQDYPSYAFSAKESITISALDAKDDSLRLEQACMKSGAQSLIDKFDKGMDTYLSRQFEEDGQELSGGEWQKIALARTFFREGDFIILDEPSAALDPEAEHKVFSMFSELCRNKSAVFISHRLSNVLMADRIVVLEDGGIIENGSHSQLMKIGGRYAYLFNLQADKYKAG